LGIDYSDFEMIAGVAFGLVVFIAYQLEKYEDRMGGKRWWED